MSWSSETGYETVAITNWSAPLVFGLYVSCFLFLPEDQMNTKVGRSTIMRRIIAFLIDNLGFAMVAAVFSSSLSVFLEYLDTGELHSIVVRKEAKWFDSAIMLPAQLVVSIVWIAYLSIPISTGKNTVGKYLMSLRVYPQDRERPLTVKESIIRIFAQWISLASWFISIPLGMFSKEKLMIHDMITKTEVFENEIE